MSKDINLISIGDVARFLKIPAHTLRYWEKEFDFYLNPPRTEGRQRRYDEDSIERLTRIMHLLKVQGYSIAGAKRALRIEQNRVVPVYQDFVSPQAMKQDFISRVQIA